MNRTGKWFLYALFVLVVTTLFLYIRFPERSVRQYLIRQAGEIFSPYALKIGTVTPAFPPGLILSEVVFQRDQQQFNILEKLKITPVYTSFFNPGRTLALTSAAYNGNIACKINISHAKKAPQVLAEATIESVELEKIAWLREIIQRDISGRLSGNVWVDSTKVAETIRARIQVAAGRIDLRVPVFSLKSFTFNSLETDLTLNRQRALIQRCILQGEQLEGELSGSITLRIPLSESLLSLSGILKMKPEFVRYLQKNLPEGLLAPEKAAAGYQIRFSGTLDKPGYSLK